MNNLWLRIMHGKEPEYLLFSALEFVCIPCEPWMEPPFSPFKTVIWSRLQTETMKTKVTHSTPPSFVFAGGAVKKLAEIDISIFFFHRPAGVVGGGRFRIAHINKYMRGRHRARRRDLLRFLIKRTLPKIWELPGPIWNIFLIVCAGRWGRFRDAFVFCGGFYKILSGASPRYFRRCGRIYCVCWCISIA